MRLKWHFTTLRNPSAVNTLHTPISSKNEIPRTRDFVTAGVPTRAFAEGNAAARSDQKPRSEFSEHFQYVSRITRCQEFTEIFPKSPVDPAPVPGYIDILDEQPPTAFCT
ncbi:MAG: hypothetical protein DRJ65_18310 [Acidobacteria bacterium]|nr:MAG: hypothetical protein DRJ65_18310 [Acidobacteriota bacterium]